MIHPLTDWNPTSLQGISKGTPLREASVFLIPSTQQAQTPAPAPP